MATENNITALTKSQLIDKRLELELREVDFSGGVLSIDVTFNSTTLTFTNIDGVTPVQINYDAVGNNLKLDYANPAVTILSDNITAFTLTYYQGDGITVSTPGVVSEIAFIEYNYDITEDGNTYSSVGRVMLRDKQ